MLYVNPLATPFTVRTEAALSQASRESAAAEELEHFFAYLLLQEMQATVPEDGLFDSGLASDFQRDMLNDALSGEVARSGQLGIAKMVREQLHQRDGGLNALLDLST
ncbi:MAG: rod-binding protein [Candidatus Hydrogenedentes bacterium]|nr:rod-binding protein [Candidatus Hydrogenedentota bacterium]